MKLGEHLVEDLCSRQAVGYKIVWRDRRPQTGHMTGLITSYRPCRYKSEGKMNSDKLKTSVRVRLYRKIILKVLHVFSGLYLF